MLVHAHIQQITPALVYVVQEKHVQEVLVAPL